MFLEVVLRSIKLSVIERTASRSAIIPYRILTMLSSMVKMPFRSAIKAYKSTVWRNPELVSGNCGSSLPVRSTIFISERR